MNSFNQNDTPSSVEMSFSKHHMLQSGTLGWHEEQVANKDKKLLHCYHFVNILVGLWEENFPDVLDRKGKQEGWSSSMLAMDDHDVFTQ